jgi:hypothetical protein
MGIEIDRERFSDEDYRRFAQRLEESLDALGQMLVRPGFGVGSGPSAPSWSCSWSTGADARCPRTPRSAAWSTTPA